MDFDAAKGKEPVAHPPNRFGSLVQIASGQLAISRRVSARLIYFGPAGKRAREQLVRRVICVYTHVYNTLIVLFHCVIVQSHNY